MKKDYYMAHKIWKNVSYWTRCQSDTLATAKVEASRAYHDEAPTGEILISTQTAAGRKILASRRMHKGRWSKCA